MLQISVFFFTFSINANIFFCTHTTHRLVISLIVFLFFSFAWPNCDYFRNMSLNYVHTHISEKYCRPCKMHSINIDLGNCSMRCTYYFWDNIEEPMIAFVFHVVAKPNQNMFVKILPGTIIENVHTSTHTHTQPDTDRIRSQQQIYNFSQNNRNFWLFLSLRQRFLIKCRAKILGLCFFCVYY